MKLHQIKEPSGPILKLVEFTVNMYVETGGSLVSDAQYTARLNKCLRCPKFGLVKPIPLKNDTVSGCTICGCPYSTKPKAKTYFSVSQLKMVTVNCPHPDGDKWEEIDKRFLLDLPFIT